jgi:uncharacterized protein YjcR
LARPRSPNRDKAKDLWIESGRTRLLKDIAEELNVSEEQVRKWKNQDRWDKVTLPNANSNVTNQKGGQLGNKNAVGNKGGAAPRHNKNALKTGEFETLFFDTLNQEEKELLETIPHDKEKLLLQEIQLLTVREHRMLKRIQSLKEAECEKYMGGDAKIPAGMMVTRYAAGHERGEWTNLKEYEGILSQIQIIEDAITRVQARKQKAIDSLHKFGYDDAHLELETMKFELELLKQNGQTDVKEDDGFIEAMNKAVEDVWSDEDG